MAMTPAQRDLHKRLEAFDFDEQPADLTFAGRLARDHGWSLDFANRVIDEYRRFVFLLAEAGHPCTPSEAVDQVWHQHLAYSRSYWHRLCRDVVGRPLHHEPTRGGSVEGEKFTDWYERTLASYRAFFGEEPPHDIWPKPGVRFAHPEAMQWVDCRRNLVIPWRQITTTFFFLLGIAAAFVTGAVMDARGSSSHSILLVIALIIVVAYLLSLMLHRVLRWRELRRGAATERSRWWLDIRNGFEAHWGGGSGGGCGGFGCGGGGCGGCGGGCGG